MKEAKLVPLRNLCYSRCLSLKATMTRKSRDRTMHGAKPPQGGDGLHHHNGHAASPDGAHEEPRGTASAPGARNAAVWPDVVVDPAPGAERIAKTMARAGLCSRRDAEAWIAAGRVAVNGATIASPAVTVTARDRIIVDGKPLPRRERTRLFLFHKPEGLVSTNADPQGRPTVFDALPANLPRLISVGRLDIGTEGLLLLTNDGGLARVLELPQTGWLRCYRVRAHGHVEEADLAALGDGITIDGVHYGPIEAKLEHQQGSNAWLAFAIREGKNREVRNVLAHLGLMVNRLIRVAFGPFRLDDLAPGAIAEVPTAQLRKELGERIVAQAGCDFSAPLMEHDIAAAREGRASRGDRVAREGRDQRDSARREGKTRDRHDDPRERAAGYRGGRDKRGGNSGRGKPDADERGAKPRPRRGHAWRQDDSPLRRHYRGGRRAALRTDDEATPDRRAGLLTDRKGRRILVERSGAGKALEKTAEPVGAPGRIRTPAEPRQSRTPRAARPPRRPPRDRAAGPRPSRPKLYSNSAPNSGSKSGPKSAPKSGPKSKPRRLDDHPERPSRSPRRPPPYAPRRPRPTRER
jgi:23S rRNA pseudouridine2605 synthase